MAKQEVLPDAQDDGLLTLKSELWQSNATGSVYGGSGLLTLKSELWQSESLDKMRSALGLLTLKSELWQSREHNHGKTI